MIMIAQNIDINILQTQWQTIPHEGGAAGESNFALTHYSVGMC